MTTYSASHKFPVSKAMNLPAELAFNLELREKIKKDSSLLKPELPEIYEAFRQSVKKYNWPIEVHEEIRQIYYVSPENEIVAYKFDKAEEGEKIWYTVNQRGLIKSKDELVALPDAYEAKTDGFAFYQGFGYSNSDSILRELVTQSIKSLLGYKLEQVNEIEKGHSQFTEYLNLNNKGDRFYFQVTMKDPSVSTTVVIALIEYLEPSEFLPEGGWHEIHWESNKPTIEEFTEAKQKLTQAVESAHAEWEKEVMPSLVAHLKLCGYDPKIERNGLAVGECHIAYTQRHPCKVTGVVKPSALRGQNWSISADDKEQLEEVMEAIGTIKEKDTERLEEIPETELDSAVELL